MKIKKNLGEVRKFIDSWNQKPEGYVKYESSFKVLKKTDEYIVIQLQVIKHVLSFQLLSWKPMPDELYKWIQDPENKSVVAEIPLSCIQGDPEFGDFLVENWIVNKYKDLINLVPYEERYSHHQDKYKVFDIDLIQRSIEKANAEARIMKPEYEIAQEALLSVDKEMRGYVLPKLSVVTIADFHILNSGIKYSVIVINPTTGVSERYTNWINHDELLSKKEHLDVLLTELNLI